MGGTLAEDPVWKSIIFWSSQFVLSPIEQTLFVMHLKRRMRTFQGVFHANPDYALWYGWSEMIRDLTEIKFDAEELRAGHSN